MRRGEIRNQDSFVSVIPLDAAMRGDDLFSTPLDQAEIDFENEGGETYICGNPPYKGTRYQTAEQKEELQAALGEDFSNGASLDYIAGWIFKSSEICRQENFRCALVSTSSVCEGQQASILWSQVLKGGNRIFFAHRPFRWRNLASHNAAVTVIIVGIENGSSGEASLFSEENGETISRAVPTINAYLVPSKDIFVTKATQSISGLQEMVSGEKLTDGGNLVLSQQDFDALVKEHAVAADIAGRLVGAQELTKGIRRYALVIPDEKLELARSIPEIASRLDNVREMCAASSKAATRALSRTPHKFDESRFQRTRKVAVAQLLSENREYFPCDLLNEVDVPMAPSLAIYGASTLNILTG